MTMISEQSRKSTVLERLNNHIAGMAPHQKERRGGNLLIEAADEIAALRKQITDMEEAFLITKTHD